MSRSEEVVSIFLASPGDVAEERVRLAEVVARWNRTWRRHFGIRLELLRWEDDAYPDIGDDAQDVINRQIPDDWDMFVGIMWSRFGTPTARYGSGTQEEFERALARHRTVPGSVSILFYFKDAPIAPSKIDAAQLQLVRSFRTSTQATGLLTWDFADADQFEKLVELHVVEMEARVARFKALVPTRDYADSAIPRCERSTYRVLGVPPAAPLAAEEFHLNIVCCEAGKSAPLHSHLTQEVFVALTGRWDVFWGPTGERHVTLEQWDTISIPPGLSRGFRNAGSEPSYLMGMASGRDPGNINWPQQVRAAALAVGVALP